MADEELDRTVKRLLESGTFEPDELPAALEGRGYAAADVAAAVERAGARIRADEDSPARKQSRDLTRRGMHLLRFGVLWLLVGLGFSLVYRAGLLGYLMVIVIGAGLIVAGRRSIAQARLPRRDY